MTELAEHYVYRPVLHHADGQESINLAFVNVSYTIQSGICKKTDKKILNSISGLMLPGLNAIMGPTGSGKTTLLDILANHKSGSRVSGTVFVGGEQIKSDFQAKRGYVIQEDIVTGSLTVRENLYFSAALRLPSSTGRKQRRARVEKIIGELGLEGCANQKIGTEFIRGVSGGEKRRTNIGMELIIEPQILFLDEPTTGLDAHTAVSVIKILKNLADGGDRIVIMSIHQPRYSIFKLFDTLTLLSLGNLVYHGQAQETLTYFSELGFECEEHDNPADFLLDVIDSCEGKQVDDKDESEMALMEGESATVDENLLETRYLQSNLYRDTQKILKSIEDGAEISNGKNGSTRAKVTGYMCTSQYATNAAWQFLIVGKRVLLKTLRNPMTSIIQLIVMVLVGVLTGGIYFQRPMTPRGMQDRMGAIFFVIMSTVFANLGAVELFIAEKMLFLHESISGYYRVSVYFIAKMLSDFLLLRILPLFVFSLISYLMIGFQLDAGKFFYFYLTVVQSTISAASMAYAFSALVNVNAVANLLVTLVFVFYMVSGGFLIGLNSLPPWISWLQYISIFRYGTEALAINELKDQIYSVPITEKNICLFHVKFNWTDNTGICYAKGNDLLEFQGYHASMVWYDQIALLSTSVVWLTLAYIFLRLVKAYYRYYK